MTRILQPAAVFTLAATLTFAIFTGGFVHAEAPKGDISAATAAKIATSNSAPEELSSSFTPLSLLSDSLWQRLRTGFTFSDIDNPRIDKQIEFLQAGLQSLRFNLESASPYLFYITDQLDRADIPLDIVLLPLIESAFNPTAHSSQSAMGIWQFIPPTAVHYGLSVDKDNDQRKDVLASTAAAIRYLSDLHRTFDGDWLIALAAYNTGPGNVRAAMRQAVKRGVEPTYWNLKLSDETNNYVPRLIAATKVISDPEKYGLQLPPVPNQKQIETVSVGRRISIAQVASLTAVSLEEIENLNPVLHKGLTPADGPHRLILPVDTASELLDELKNFKRQPLVKHAVANQPATDNKTHLATVSRETRKPLAIDSKAQNTTSLTDQQQYSSYQAYRFETHTIKPGDTLWSVARKIGVDVPTLRSWNSLDKDQPIKAGDRLYIAYPSTEKDIEFAKLIDYRVDASDSLQSIATKFGLQVREIRRWNDSLKFENHVQTGQLLRIPTVPDGF